MRTINLYFDCEFTSLSPDTQVISLGIVSDEIFDSKYQHLYKGDIDKSNCSVDHLIAKSFYAEFTDFSIERCDDWVKENVVSKLKYYGTKEQNKIFIDSSVDEGTYFGSQNTTEIKEALYRWLKQFSGYNIQFVSDCGTYDWYWLLQLIGEWKVKPEDITDNVIDLSSGVFNAHVKQVQIALKANGREVLCTRGHNGDNFYYINRIGLPKLPSNISPVPFDLNDLIAIKKGISAREAFELNREELACDAKNSMIKEKKIKEYRYYSGKDWSENNQKHNALWDARVIKTIYNKLK